MKEKKYRDIARERSSVIIIKMLNVPGKTPIFAWRNDVFINPVVVNEKGNFTGIVPGKSISANSAFPRLQWNDSIHLCILRLFLTSPFTQRNYPGKSPYQFYSNNVAILLRIRAYNKSI